MTVEIWPLSKRTTHRFAIDATRSKKQTPAQTAHTADYTPNYMNDFLEGLGPSEAERAAEYCKLRDMPNHERWKLLLHGPNDYELVWQEVEIYCDIVHASCPEPGCSYMIMLTTVGLYDIAITIGDLLASVDILGQGIPTLEKAKEICTNHYNKVMR